MTQQGLLKVMIDESGKMTFQLSGNLTANNMIMVLEVVKMKLLQSATLGNNILNTFGAKSLDERLK